MIFSTYKGLKRDVYYLCLARTINSMGDFVFSLITLFLTVQLKMDLAEVGMFVSLAAVISGPGVLIGGYLSDVLGKRMIIVIGQLVSTLLICSCILWSDQITAAYILIVIMFFISATRPAYNSLIVQLTGDEKERKTAFSLMYLGANLGIAIGPLFAGFFIRDYIQLVFASIGLIFLISTLFILKFVRVHPVSEQGIQVPQSVQTSFIKMVSQRPLVTVFIILSFLNFFVYMQYSFSIPIQMNHTFGDNGPAYYGSIMTINALSVIILTTLISSFTKNTSPLVTIAVGGVFYGAGFGMLGLLHYATSLMLVAASTVLWTIGEIMIQTNINIYIASRVPDSHQGRFNGLLLFVGCLGYTLSPYLSGLFIQYVNLETVWLYILFISLLYSGMMVGLLLYENKAARRRGLHGKLDI